MAGSIDRDGAAVERAFAAACDLTESETCRTLFEFERQLWTLILALGRTLVVRYLARRAGRPRDVAYGYEGSRYVLRGHRTTSVGTRFGKVPFKRPTGQLVGRRGACDLPVDRELGLCAGFSLGVVLAIARLCAQMAFAGARETFRQSHEWTPSPRAVLRMVDAVGDQGRRFLEEAPAPAGDGEVLVIQVDGGGAPMISGAEYQRRCAPRRGRAEGSRRRRRREMRSENPRTRRTKGEKSKNAKIAIVGVIYTLKKRPDGLEGPINKQMCATFESHEALFIWLHREAVKRGYGSKQTEFIADGSEHIWRLQERYFPDAHCCLDWAHVVEKLWIAGTCIHPEGSELLKQWVARQTAHLREGALVNVLADIAMAHDATAKTGPGNKGKRERLMRVHSHFAENEGRMRYDELRRDDLDIGSGAVEGAVRNLIRMRLDGPGMRWSRDRAERLLHLRCVLLNGQWEAFVTHVALNGIVMNAAPVPTRTHDAKAAA